MGTFHRHKGELHGITVVVETDQGELWVGRCDDATEQGVALLDADVHRPGEGAPSREEFLRRAAAVGVWGTVAEVLIPRQRVTSLRRLGELGER